jgi:hypothetical protein
MTSEQIENSIQNNELNLGTWDKFNHYSIVWFLLFMPTVVIFLHLKDYFTGRPYSINGGDLIFSIIPITLALFFYKSQQNKLKFKIAETSIERPRLDKIIHNVASKLKWKIYSTGDNFVLAKTNPSFFSGSWGEQITILFDKNRVLINSICDLDKRTSVVSMGRNRRNMNTLFNEIQNASR